MNILVIVVIGLLIVGGLALLAQSPRSSDLERVYGNPSKLVELVEKKSEKYILVDVRTPEEFASGHIPSAINIPVDVIQTSLPTEDKDALLILYCRGGRRSGAAKQILERAGFRRLVNFGAVSRWPGNLISGQGQK